jgi:hypothetical protein
MTAEATRAVQDPDPWQGSARFTETFVQLRATSCGLDDALSTDDRDQAIDTEVTRLRQAVGELVRHAQRAGALRSDIDWGDVPFVLARQRPPRQLRHRHPRQTGPTEAQPQDHPRRMPTQPKNRR